MTWAIYKVMYFAGSRLPQVIWIGVVFWLANAAFINVYPFVTGDEVIGNDPASEWVLHGRVRSSVFEELPGYARGYFVQPPGQFLTGVVAYGLFGFGPGTTRLAAITWGALAVIAIGYLAVAWCGSRRAGVFAAGLLALNPEFTQSVGQARMDAQAIALLLAGCLVFHRWPVADSKRTRGGQLALAGGLVGLGGITHPLAIFFAVGLGLAGWLRTPRNTARGAAIFFGTMGVPLLVWLGFAAALPDEFTQQFLRHGASKVTHLNVWSELGMEWTKLCKVYVTTPLLALALAGGCIWWWRASSVSKMARRESGWLLATLGSAVALVMDKGSGPYELYPTTILCVWAGGMLADGWDRMESANGWRRGLAVVAGTLLAVNLVVKFTGPRLVAITLQREARDLAALDAAVAEMIPRGAVVCGIPEYFYAVKGAGAWVRMAVAADARKHDYVIARPDPGRAVPAGFVRIGELGREMPKFWGRDFSTGLDYKVEVFASVVRGRSR